MAERFRPEKIKVCRRDIHEFLNLHYLDMVELVKKGWDGNKRKVMDFINNVARLHLKYSPISQTYHIWWTLRCAFLEMFQLIPTDGIRDYD